MSKLKILIFNWRCWLNPKAGGAEVYIHEIAKRWVKTGHEVTLFTSEFPGCAKEETMDGIKIIRAGGKYSVYWKAMKYYKNNFKHNFDVILEAINTIPFFTPTYASEPQVSLIFQITGEVFYKVFPKPVAISARYIEPLIYKKFYKENIALVLSKSVKDELVKIGFKPDHVFVAEPGIDYEYYSLGEKTEYPSILYLNRIVPYKNVDHLIKAFKIVKYKVPDAKLHIVGCRGTAYESKLRKLAKKLGILDSIEFHGFLSGAPKREFLQKAWVHVLPSTKEGWGISVLEAASCGTPTVAYNVTGLRDSVKDKITGILVPFNDIEALATAITKILTNKQLRIQLSKNARKWALQFSWERTAKIALNAIKNAI
ncbi:MAG: glycosyltransferase family 1 protein [Thermoplasmata archaeon]|nr:MAG: glycosyltransferase family 1 protein [Thermoplasmata archaeon]